MHPSPDPTLEAFGQRGILPDVWRGFVILCAIGCCTCLIMLKRSQSQWDSLVSSTAQQQVAVMSVIGRLVVDVLPPDEHSAVSSIPNFETQPFTSIEDGWAPSWKKTLGIEWGYESPRRFSFNGQRFWRLRIRWRTLAFLYALPVAYELSRRAWKRFGPPSSDSFIDAPPAR